MAAFPIQELPFTDRVAESRILEGLVEKVSTTGHGSLVLVLGEAGIGKTRLATEFRKFASSKNFRWLSAKCLRSEDLAPYTPWIQLLREFVSEASVQQFFKVSGADLEQIVRLIPELTESTGIKPSPPPTGLSTEEEVRQRFQFFQSLARFFIRLSGESPLILFFDDLQWADPATIQLLGFFGETALKDGPVLLVTACRDFEAVTDKNQGVSNFLENMQRGDMCQTIKLDRFDDRRVKQLLVNVSGRSDVSREFMDLIHSKTGGNPLFMQEVLKALFEKKDIFTNERGQWDRRPISEIRIPSTILDVIAQRLDRLDDKARTIFQTATVIGEKFDVQVLRKMIQDEDRLDSILEAGLSSGLLGSKSSAEMTKSPFLFSFSDESVHDVLYHEIPSDQLKELHLKVGIALEETRSDSLDEVAAELANHFSKAGDQRKAFKYSVRAGDRASALYAHEEAAKHYGHALMLLERNGTPEQELQRAKLLSQLGEETYRFMGGDSGAKYLEEAVSIFEKNGQKKFAGMLLMRLSEIYFLAAHDKEKALAVSNKAAESFANEAPRPELVYTMGIGYVLVNLWAGERARAQDWANKLEQINRQIGDQKMISLWSCVHVEMNHISEKLRIMDEIDRGLEYLLKTDDIRMIIYAQFHRAVSRDHTSGPSEASLKLLTEYEEYASKTGYFDLVFYYKGLICDDYIALGDWQRARSVVDDLFESLRKFPNNPTLYYMSNLFRGRLFLYTGELDKSEECLKIAMKGRLLSPLFAQTAFVYLCRLYMERKDFGRATEVVEEGYNVSKSKGLTMFTALRHTDLMSALVDLDVKKKNTLQEAQTHLEEMRAMAGQIDEDWAYAYLHRAEGIFYSNQLDFENTFRSFQKSSELWEKLHWPYEAAKTKYETAVAYFKIDDSQEAIRNLEEASILFANLGAIAEIKKCEELRREVEFIGPAPGFKVRTSSIFNFLADSFVQDNLVRNLSPESSGWRTLAEIAKNTGLPSSSLYGKISGQIGSSPIMKELLSSGYVESKTFPGERGRGGEITRFRIKYEREDVRNYAKRQSTMRSEMLH